jgi:DtxR family manganese transport transcriptional regulator
LPQGGHGENLEESSGGSTPIKGRQSMTDSKLQESTRFHRTREDHASETAEDYVEAIADAQEKSGGCRGIELAKLFGVSHVTVSKILARLQSEGLIDTKPYGPVRLTERGQALAKRSRERHETVLHFLLTLGVRRSIAEIDSEGIEHHVSDETLRAFRRFLRKNKP